MPPPAVPDLQGVQGVQAMQACPAASGMPACSAAAAMASCSTPDPVRCEPVSDGESYDTDTNVDRERVASRCPAFVRRMCCLDYLLGAGSRRPLLASTPPSSWHSPDTDPANVRSRAGLLQRRTSARTHELEIPHVAIEMLPASVLPVDSDEYVTSSTKIASP